MAGAKLVTSKQMRKVKKQRVPAFGIIGVNISKYTVGLEKVVPPIPGTKLKVPTTFIEAMNEVAVTPISDVPRNKRILGTKRILRTAYGRIKARLVALVRKKRRGTDCVIVVAKDKFGRPRNGTLAQGELLTQYSLGKQYTISWVKCLGTVTIMKFQNQRLLGKNDMT